MKGRDSQGGQGLPPQDGSARFEFTLDVPEPRLWTPETPNLYAATLELSDGANKVSRSRRDLFRPPHHRQGKVRR